MSFSSQVKNEISRIELQDNGCVLCEISSVLRMGGHFEIQENGYISSRISTENAAFARRVIKNIVHNFNLHPGLIVSKGKKLKAHTLYSLEMIGTHATSVLLGDAGLLRLDKNRTGVFNPPEEIMGQECCLKSYIRGAFMVTGSVSDPEKSYHLEIASGNEKEIIKLAEILNELDLKAKVIERKRSFVCYIKEAESIADFLNIIGAHHSLMTYENIRIVKEIRNNVNRVVNFESANLDKTVNASSRHVESINYIINKVGLESLDENLQEIASLRIENPEISLNELGQLLNPPLGKSGVNHRLKRIEEAAERIRSRLHE
ncbi:MAG: DNA-binding protein WhiA [Clostridia bacterium]|nr:DNA-binding protein WhiA [Clostridia bacterium]